MQTQAEVLEAVRQAYPELNIVAVEHDDEFGWHAWVDDEDSEGRRLEVSEHGVRLLL